MVKVIQLSCEFEQGTKVRLSDFINDVQDFLDEEYPGAEVTKNILMDKSRKKKSSYS